MMAPPKTLAAAAVRPSRMLVRMGFIRAKRDDTSLFENSPRRHREEPKTPSCLLWLPLAGLTGMADVHDIAVLDNVVLALEAKSSLGAGVGFGAGFEQLIPADRFRANEMFLEIGMDRACSLLGAGMRGDLPCAAFVLAGCEERDESQQLISSADQTGQTTFREAVAREKFGGIGIVHLGELGFDFSANCGGAGVATRG